MKKLLLFLFILTTGCLLEGTKDVTSRYLNAITVGDAVEYKNLRIFPLIAQKTLSTQHYVTLDEAVDKGWLKMKEVGTGQIEFVEMKNTGPKIVFIMTGEVISGAKQDRMTKEDILLGAKSEWIRVPVYCVEHGRWVSVTPEFQSAKVLVPNAVRQRAKITESQSDVWEEIAQSQDELGIASETGTVRSNYQDAGVQHTVDEYARAFKAIPTLSSLTVGVVVTTENRIICCDLFAHNKLLQKLWNKLIQSYAMDALHSERGTVTKRTIEEFLTHLKDVRYVSAGTPGAGQLFKTESFYGKGSALIHDATIVHMDFFPTISSINDPRIRLDFRRDQRMDN